MNILIIALLAVVQGLAELLPVSSSAHVILVEKFLHLNPSSPEMTFLLVMLHTGTMFAVLVFFWKRWAKLLSKDNKNRWNFIKMLIIATIATGLLGLGLQYIIEKVFMQGFKNAEIENIFGNTWIIGAALGAVGILIIISGFLKNKSETEEKDNVNKSPVKNSIIIGLVQGLALPFRGFSRSGSTISTSLFLGLPRQFAEEFSFALSVILTPPVILREFLRLHHSNTAHVKLPYLPGLLGMVLSFLVGLFAINWLNSWLEKGRWSGFGYYCILLAALILVLTGIKII